jgi:PEGA domain-containing protein
MTKSVPLLLLLVLVPVIAAAQTVPRPNKGTRKYTIKIDSSPQQAAIYLDDKRYGIVGYTPWTGKVERGDYQLIIELQGYKPFAHAITIDSGHREFFFPLEKAVLPGTIDIQAAADANVLGAQVFVDGQLQGTAPIPLEAPEGRHLVEVKKAGFHDYSQWVTVKQGERVTIAPVVKSAESAKGSLLVDADVRDATVRIDGKPMTDTTPVLVDGLEEGQHIVEVAKPPAVPWKQTVYVKGGQRSKVTAELSATMQASQGGNVRVLSNVLDAEVWVDGTFRGKAPLDVNGLASGMHIVDVKAPGYDTHEEKVTVNAGSATIVKMDLTVAPQSLGAQGRIKVVSPVPEAQVFIDGANVGRVPVDKEVAAGDHFVTVQQVGFGKFAQKIRVEPSQTLTVTAELRAAGGLRFVATPEGADVVLDGAPIGKAPLTREDIDVGDHVVTIRKQGFYDFEQPVRVEGGKMGIINANLRSVNTGPTAADIIRMRRGLSSWGARTMPYGRFTVDGALGYPYWLEARATVGVRDDPAFGWDVSVGFRTYLTTWEFLGTGRFRFFGQDPFAFSAFGTVGGGGGAAGRNQFTLDFGLLSSITFENLVTVTGRTFVDVWSDRLCGTPDRGQTMPTSGPDVCTGMASAADVTRAQELAGMNYVTDRNNGARFYLSLVVEAAVDNQISLFAVFEGAPFQNQRAAHTSIFNSTLLSKEDPIYNGKVGITFKF